MMDEKMSDERAKSPFLSHRLYRTGCLPAGYEPPARGVLRVQVELKEMVYLWVDVGGCGRGPFYLGQINKQEDETYLFAQHRGWVLGTLGQVPRHQPYDVLNDILDELLAVAPEAVHVHVDLHSFYRGWSIGRLGRSLALLGIGLDDEDEVEEEGGDHGDH